MDSDFGFWILDLGFIAVYLCDLYSAAVFTEMLLNIMRRCTLMLLFTQFLD